MTVSGCSQCDAILHRNFRQREEDLKTRVPGLRSDLNVSPMFSYNALHGVEAEAGSFSDCLGGEERFKDVRFYFG